MEQRMRLELVAICAIERLVILARDFATQLVLLPRRRLGEHQFEGRKKIRNLTTREAIPKAEIVGKEESTKGKKEQGNANEAKVTGKKGERNQVVVRKLRVCSLPR